MAVNDGFALSGANALSNGPYSSQYSLSFAMDPGGIDAQTGQARPMSEAMHFSDSVAMPGSAYSASYSQALASALFSDAGELAAAAGGAAAALTPGSAASTASNLTAQVRPGGAAAGTSAAIAQTIAGAARTSTSASSAHGPNASVQGGSDADAASSGAAYRAIAAYGNYAGSFAQRYAE